MLFYYSVFSVPLHEGIVFGQLTGYQWWTTKLRRITDTVSWLNVCPDWMRVLTECVSWLNALFQLQLLVEVLTVSQTHKDGIVVEFQYNQQLQQRWKRFAQILSSLLVPTLLFFHQGLHFCPLFFWAALKLMSKAWRIWQLLCFLISVHLTATWEIDLSRVLWKYLSANATSFLFFLYKC